MKILWLLLATLFIHGCNAPGNSVQVISGNITTTALFSMNNEDIDGKTVDIGDQVLTDSPLPLTVRVYNSTEKPYTDLDLEITVDGTFAPAITFAPSDEGGLAYPGYKGTCGRVLQPKSACLIQLLFSPRDGRVYLEKLTLKFKNYIDPETHTATLKSLAGLPASLTFTNDITQYTFGNLVGTAQVPVVERAEDTTYEETLEVINAGGLPAKSLVVTEAEVCSSTLTNTCPAGMDDVYSIENSCPNILQPGEKCLVKVTYKPKNSDPASGTIPDESKEINYRSTVNFAYTRDPKNSAGALNGYFRSISTTIEAKFKVAITSITFETPIVTGNRETRSFRVNNTGYREGEIKAIAFRDSGGSLIATCSAAPSTDILACYNSSNALVPLSTLPFTVKDKNSCLAPPPGVGTLINVSQGCIFDISFQPSLTFLTDLNTEFQNLQPEVVYDSRWRGNPTIQTNKLFNLSAKSQASARLVFDKLTYDGTTFASTGADPWEIDLKRLTLQSPNFFKRKAMLITFKNVGSVPATNVTIKDALNRVIPFGGAGANLGAKAPYFFTSASASESTCKVIGQGETCAISLLYAPIGMTTNAEEDANMFDAIGADSIKYKGFIVSYDSGSLYTDSNLTDTPDVPISSAEARVKAQLIRKGLLMQFADDARNVSNFGTNANVAGDTIVSHLYVQNIGTGTIPYIRLQNPPIAGPPSNNPDVTLLTTSDPASLGAEYDCLSIMDVDSTYLVPPTALPSTRVGNFAGLPKDNSCVLTVQMKTSDTRRAFNSRSCNTQNPATTNLEEGVRLTSLDYLGLPELWEFCTSSANEIRWNNIALTYYDGDASDPTLSPPSSYGRNITHGVYSYRAVQTTPGKLIPNSFTPWLTSTMYRSPINYPQISSLSAQAARTITEKWFYGANEMFYHVKDDSAQTSPLIQADESRDFVQTLSGFSNRSNYDYIYYVGSFPKGSPTVNFTLSIKNFGGAIVKLTNFHVTPDPSFTSTNVPSSFPISINASGLVSSNMSFNFATNVAGEHHMTIDYTYESGLHTVPLVYRSNTVASNISSAGKSTISQKILVIGHVQDTNTYPVITLQAEDYDVVSDPGNAPIETIQAPYSVPLTWNTSTPTSNLVFDSIKYTTASPTASDLFAKKRITVTNNTAYPMADLKTIYRLSEAASAVQTVSTSFTAMAGSTCTSGMTLAPYSSCTILFKYQPNNSASREDFVMSLMYRMGVGQYVIQNTKITLFPRSPAALVADGKATEIINYKASAGSSSISRPSYPLNFGLGNTLNVVPKPFNFVDASGTYKKVQLKNTQTTKASLLLAYYKQTGKVSPAVPTVSEYTTYAGEDYVTIYNTKYSDNSDKLILKASKGCLFGDDESNASIPAHKKGFSSTSTKPCYLLTYFNANFEFLNKTIDILNGDDMRGVAIEIWYYSVERSATASVWVHLRGQILPDVSGAIGNNTDVKAFDNKTISFVTQKMQANSPSLGAIVGLRVLMSTSSTGLNDPYSTALTNYFDIKPYDSINPQYADFITGLANSTYYYFRVVAIRKDTRFTDVAPKRFVGLAANEYLSAAGNNVTPLKVLVPPVNHYYFHDKKVVVEKSLFDGVKYDAYLTSSNKCATRTKLTLKDPGNISLSYQLIKNDIWPLLLSTPAATNYSNMTQISHWVGDAKVSIDTMCSGLPGYVANNSSQTLTSSSVFYLRNTSTPSALVNQVIGGIPGTSYSNFRSFVDGTVGFASTRCMVVVP